MKQYYILGENIFFEMQNQEVFLYRFYRNKLKTFFTVSDDIFSLAQEVQEKEYKKELSIRIKFFNRG